MRCYFTAYLDRVNVGFAALTLTHPLIPVAHKRIGRP
jgi:hypothetical protein